MDNKAAYEQRRKRIEDAMALREPDMVPMAPKYNTFPYLFAGYTMSEINFDLSKAFDAIRKYLRHFQPDMACGPKEQFAGQGPMLEKMGIKWMRFAGQNGSTVDDRSIFQYLEEDYMKAYEYDELLTDLQGWIWEKYLPRTFAFAEPFARLNIKGMTSYGFMPSTRQFADPEVFEAFKTLHELGKDYVKYYEEISAFDKEIEEMGFVQQVAATNTCAYDKLSDSLRGTLGTFSDLRKRRDKMEAAIEMFFPSTVEGMVAQAQHSNGRFGFIALHKGMDKFMTDEQYKNLYWDTLLRMVNGMIENGITPWIYAEGPYDSRVECLMDVPKGKCWIHFEDADMKRVKKLLGNVACLSGGIRSDILLFGKKDQIVDKVKENMDILAPGGGYIFDMSDTIEDAKPENVELLFETVREYGKY